MTVRIVLCGLLICGLTSWNRHAAAEETLTSNFVQRMANQGQPSSLSAAVERQSGTSSERIVSMGPPQELATAQLNGTFSLSNANGNGNGDGPEHIRDNAFLVEEAANQEPGVVQHIINWVNFWDRIPGGRTRDFALIYTMELPVGSQKHQFSFATSFLTAFEKTDANGPSQAGDIGDTFLNYRYQLLADDDFLWASPRFSLIAPTGDERFGFGNGEWGYQWNLPVSRYGERFDFHFNAGFTYIPNVSLPIAAGGLSPSHDLKGYNLGASVFWKHASYLHSFVELAALWSDEIDDQGARNRIDQVLINPGVRYAICKLEDVEWVIGLSVPVGLTDDSPDIGLFAYMSVEHAFRKKDNANGCGE